MSTAANNSVPYDRLVRFAVIQGRINEMAQEFYRLDEQIGHWISEQLFGPDGTEYPVGTDLILEEFMAATAARRESEDADAS